MTPTSGLRSGEVTFSTSGQSGEPVVWLRTEEQLHAEAALLAQTVIGEVDRVINFAPPHHLYGRVLGELVPGYLDVPVQQMWRTPLAVPDLCPGERLLLVCLPATWVMLRSLADRLRSTPQVTAVHSTGPTTTIARQLIRSLAGSPFRAVEILGATETGAIAHRTLAPRPADPALWTLCHDVTLVHDGIGREQPLRVAGPRLARTRDMDRRPDTLVLDDLVRPVDERHFELFGRRSRMIKINGRRIRLDQVEHMLRKALAHVDVVCVPRIDRVRAEHYDLFYADDVGRTTPADIHSVLVAAFPGIPLPRRVRRVGHIPRSATGKVRLDRLLAPTNGRREVTSGAR